MLQLSASDDDEFLDLEDEETHYCPVCGAENTLNLGECFECGAKL
jgi:hypothetical protein